MSIKIGITGGIGSGKSVVSRLLEVLQVPIYISDLETRQLMVEDVEIRDGLVALLGEQVYLPDGMLNKPLLASYLFASADHARQINGLVHPRVKNDFRQWAALRSQHACVGMESAILLEAGFRNEVDVVVMVYAPKEVRIARAVKRDCSSREAILKRIESQMDDEEKCLKADYVIINDGVTPLIPQVLSLLRKLSV